MRNFTDIKPKKPVEFSPQYVLWCAHTHLDALKRRHTAAMQEASELADQIARCEEYVAGLELGENPA